MHLSRADCIDAGFIKLWEWDYDCNHYDHLVMLVDSLRSDNLVKPGESSQNMDLHQELDHGCLKV